MNPVLLTLIHALRRQHIGLTIFNFSSLCLKFSFSVKGFLAAQRKMRLLQMGLPPNLIITWSLSFWHRAYEVSRVLKGDKFFIFFFLISEPELLLSRTGPSRWDYG